MKEDKLSILFDKICKIFHLKFKDKTKKLFLQMFKFLLVGGLAFVIDYVTLIICKEVFNIPVLISAAIAFTVSVVVNYILSVKWVFDVDEDKSKTKNFILFILFSVMGLGINVFIMWQGELLLQKIFANNQMLYDKAYMIVKIFATAVVMVFNFITRKSFLE